MKTIVDTGFLSSLAKIDRLQLITEFFNTEEFSKASGLFNSVVVAQSSFPLLRQG